MGKVKQFWGQLVRTPFKRFSLHKAEATPNEFIGKTVLARREMEGPDEPVEIKTILGNVQYPRFFEINGTHFVSILSCYLQIFEGRVPTEEETEEFNLATDIVKIKELKG